jgi:hypothetical protein
MHFSCELLADRLVPLQGNNLRYPALAALHVSDGVCVSSTLGRRMPPHQHITGMKKLFQLVKTSQRSTVFIRIWVDYLAHTAGRNIVEYQVPYVTTSGFTP